MSPSRSDEEGSSLWNSDRQETFRLLSGLDRSLATMHKVAINLMAELPEPGEERARLSSVGHCVREILNNLPEALSDVEGAPRRGHDDGASSRQLARAVETTLAAVSGVGANGGDDEVRSVSIPVSDSGMGADQTVTITRQVARW